MHNDLHAAVLGLNEGRVIPTCGLIRHLPELTDPTNLYDRAHAHCRFAFVLDRVSVSSTETIIREQDLRPWSFYNDRVSHGGVEKHC